MKYLVEGKSYNVPDEEVNKLVDTLEISIAEACEIWLSDHDIIVDETVEELTKKAQKNRVTATIHDAKGEKKERKPREKKENPVKKMIIEAIYDILACQVADDNCIFIRNSEKYIDFTIDGRNFTVNLVEHRPKKEK